MEKQCAVAEWKAPDGVELEVITTLRAAAKDYVCIGAKFGHIYVLRVDSSRDTFGERHDSNQRVDCLLFDSECLTKTKQHITCLSSFGYEPIDSKSFELTVIDRPVTKRNPSLSVDMKVVQFSSSLLMKVVSNLYWKPRLMEFLA